MSVGTVLATYDLTILAQFQLRQIGQNSLQKIDRRPKEMQLSSE